MEVEAAFEEVPMTVLSGFGSTTATDRSIPLDRRRRAAGIALLATLMLLTGVALVPARAERTVERTTRTAPAAPHSPARC